MSKKLPPMPPQIDVLPRDDRGYPVPYISDWTSREPDPVITTHPQLGRIADCGCRITRGEPILGEPCLRRARKCVREQLCSTCGGDLRYPGTMVWPSMFGDEGSMFTEPANHPECLAWALKVCPFLVTKGRDPHNLFIVTAERYRVRQIRHTRSAGVGLTVIDPDMSPQAHRTAPGYLYGYAITPLDPTRMRVDEWLHLHDDGS